jgi:hypothetical protein
MRAAASAPIRDAMTVNQVSSALCRAERTIRVTRAGAGGLIRSARQRRNNSARITSGFRSAFATFAASQSVSLSASATEHSRNPRCSPIWLRWYSMMLPDHHS